MEISPRELLEMLSDARDEGANSVSSRVSALSAEIIGLKGQLERASAVVNRTALRELVGAVNKVEAIKAHRTLTGDGLKESKDWVEAHHPMFRHVPIGALT